jgi:hypothetical protein
LIKTYGTDEDSKGYLSSLKRDWSEARRKGVFDGNALHGGLQIPDGTSGMGVSELRYGQQPVPNNGRSNTQSLPDLRQNSSEQKLTDSKDKFQASRSGFQ